MKMLFDAALVERIGDEIVRSYRIPAGTSLVTHEHPYDHLSFLLSGEARVTANGKDVYLRGPASMEIKAGIAHGILAITDCEWECRHAFAMADAAAKAGDKYVMSGVGG